MNGILTDNPFPGIGIAAGSFAVVFGGVTLARRSLPPEASRKLVHVAMGLVTLSFPFLFLEPWPVWALSGLFIVTLSALRFLGPLRQRFGQTLGGVERQSWGEFYFPMAVAIVFTLSYRRPANYVIALLVLTLGDAVAALVGLRFGKLRYRTDEGCKTIEGSLALCLVAALCTAVPALLMTHQPVVRAAIAGVCVGVLAALVEAISWRGLDNLFLPLATLALLNDFWRRSTPELLVRLVVAIGLLTLLLLWRQRTTLRDDALAGATLVLYLCFTIGGWLWLEPPLVVAVAYTFLPFRPERISPDIHGNWVMLSLAGAGFLWLFLERGEHTGDYLLPYVLSFALQLSMVFLARWKRGRPSTPAWRIIAGAAFAAWLFIFLPAMVSAAFRPALGSMVLALVLIIAVTGLFCIFEGHPRNMPNNPRRWLIQTTLALAGSAAGLLPAFKV